jgi:hypothetical protein
MKLRITYSLIYILSVIAYILLPKEDPIRWHTILTSTAGVVVVFSIVGKFIWEKAKPSWMKPFRIILIVINALHLAIVPLGFWSGYYANAFLSVIFIAPMTALLIETFIPREIKEKTPNQSIDPIVTTPVD